jgi:hypothetical protein
MEDVGEVLDRILAVLLAGRDEGVEDGEPACSLPTKSSHDRGRHV